MTRPTSSWYFLVTAAFFLASPSNQVQAQDFTGDGTAYTLGSTSSGNCNMMAAHSDASVNYVALNDPQWDGSKNCGRCIQVSCADDRCADKSITEVVHVLDRCPECKKGDLDLSPTVFKKITGSKELDRYKVKWQFVDCPVSGNIKYCLKSGSNPYYVAIQPTNVVSSVASMKINNQATTMVDSAYYYLLDGESENQVDLAQVEITLASKDNQAITETVALTVGSCTEGALQFTIAGGGGGDTGGIGAEADTMFALQVESVEPAPSPEMPSSDPLQAAPEPAVVDTTTTVTTAIGSDNTPAPVVTITPAPASDPPSTAPVVTVISTPAPVSNPPSSAPAVVISLAPVPPPAAATAPVVAPHPSVHRCKVKHTGDHKNKDDAQHKPKDY